MLTTVDSHVAEEIVSPSVERHKHPFSGPASALLYAVTPAMLVLTPIFAPFLSSRHRFIYHEDGSAATVLVAVLINLLAGWLLFAAAFLAAEAWPRWRPVLWTLFLASIPPLLIRDYTAVMAEGVPHWIGRPFTILSVVVIPAAALVWHYRRANFLSAMAALQTLTFFFSLAWLVTVAQLGMYAFTTRGLNAQRPLHRATSPVTPAQAHPRVVWIIFDELGYNPAFQGRPAGLLLPALDAMAAQSTNFSDASSPGLYTEYVVPRLLLALPYASFDFTSSGRLQLRDGPGHSLRAFVPRETVFGDALQDGYRTALIGWHNPYCRIMSSVLDSCFWSARVNSGTADFDGQASLTDNVLGPARHLWRNLRYTNALERADAAEIRQHIDDLQRLTEHADAVLRSDNAGFVLIHLPVPHPSGIWSRSRASFDTSGHASYIDNLVLADRVLAHLRDDLQARNEWNSTAIVIMGDHSWRTSMRWQNTPSWTPEDQTVSGGKFDPRPVYLVKLPNQQTAATVHQPFSTYRTRALLDAIMTHSGLNTPADLQRWAAKQ